MLKIVVRRLLLSIPVLLMVGTLVFGLLHLAPGDPAVRAAGGIEASPEAIELARERLGLNESFLSQYWTWLSAVARGDLGNSLFTTQPVGEAIIERIPISLSLTAGTLLVALLIALPAGLITSVRPGSALDRFVVVATSAGIATPSFVVGFLAVLIFSIRLDLLPAIGYSPLEDGVVDWARHLILPCASLGIAVSAELTRFIRSSLRHVLGEDYIRTARAKGLPLRSVVGKHAMKNAAIPVVTVIGVQIRNILGGAVVIETVFALNGVGTLAVAAVFGRDYPMIQGVALFAAVGVLVTNLLVDISYAYFNPKVRGS